MTVAKYIVGAIILSGFLAITIKSIVSFINAIRERIAQKKSPVKDEEKSTAPSDEDTGKEVQPK